jgi:hypothetical protein
MSPPVLQWPRCIGELAEPPTDHLDEPCPRQDGHVWCRFPEKTVHNTFSGRAILRQRSHNIEVVLYSASSWFSNQSNRNEQVQAESHFGREHCGQWSRDIETQLLQLAFNPVITPAQVFFGQTHDQVLLLIINSRSAPFAFVFLCPFAAYQVSMPAKNSLWLNQSNQLSELVGGSFGLFPQFGSQNCQGHPFCSIGSYGLLQFSFGDA